MFKVYISSSSVDAALGLAQDLKSAGYEIVSTWHDRESAPPLEDETFWSAAFDENCTRIQNADLFVLIADPDRAPGGKFVEAGVALAAMVPVAILGRVENRMLQAAEYKVADRKALHLLLQGLSVENLDLGGREPALGERILNGLEQFGKALEEAVEDPATKDLPLEDAVADLQNRLNRAATEEALKDRVTKVIVENPEVLDKLLDSFQEPVVDEKPITVPSPPTKLS